MLPSIEVIPEVFNMRGGTVSQEGRGVGELQGSLKSIKEVTATVEALQSGHVAHS